MVISISFILKYLFFFFFYFLVVDVSIHILYMSPLSDICFMNVFFYTNACLYFLKMSFNDQNFSSFDEV